MLKNLYKAGVSICFILLSVGCKDDIEDKSIPYIQVISPAEGSIMDASEVDVVIELEDIDLGGGTYSLEYMINNNSRMTVRSTAFTIADLLDDDYQLVVSLLRDGLWLNADTVNFGIMGQGPFSVLIEGGTGSGSYLPGDLVPIKSYSSSYPYLFSHWSGDTHLLVDSTKQNTSFTMSESDVYLKANDKVDPGFTVTVTVTNGEGSGTYHPGDTVYINSTLSDPVTFSHWTGDNEVLTDSTLANTQFVVDINNLKLSAQGSVSDVSFSQHLFPVIQASCNAVGCHDASSDPAFTTYESIAMSGESIVIKTQNRNMPPPLFGSLTDEQIEIIRVWVEEGRLNN
ncbi:hypothetical protein [Marinoscillum sp. MHG1-6]|uniref:InlB B-repeat-containing protein n=1 Tax=Marinoscillum sp. MHG1-6 TaxID=2959627 RepID=UPI002158975F|nr:hypothetical protein [Marinoscillum sp. MHG1-6]